ncbi:MAG: phospholipid scramblase-related protein [Thermoanaerobaculia bacterium]
MICPQCSHEQPAGLECELCGIVFAKYRPPEERAVTQAEPEAPMMFHGRPVYTDPLDRLLLENDVLRIEQERREWLEILTNWEQANEYTIRDSMRMTRGMVVEQGRGFGAAMTRSFLGSHRPLDLAVLSADESQLVLRLTRPFHWFFSELTVSTPDGRRLGKVERRFAWVRRTYDLYDGHGALFARIVSPALKIWTFPVLDAAGVTRAEIRKKWSGLGQEYFTDADKFRLEFRNDGWGVEKRAVVFAAALSIDFDFFENNQKRN